MSTIRLGIDYLRAEERKVVLLRAEFDRFAALPPCHLGSAPDVQRAFTRFEERWDDRRADFSGGLQGIADALSVIRKTFEQVDCQMATELRSPAASGGPEF